VWVHTKLCLCLCAFTWHLIGFFSPLFLLQPTSPLPATFLELEAEREGASSSHVESIATRKSNSGEVPPFLRADFYFDDGVVPEVSASSDAASLFVELDQRHIQGSSHGGQEWPGAPSLLPAADLENIDDLTRVGLDTARFRASLDSGLDSSSSLPSGDVFMPSVSAAVDEAAHRSSHARTLHGQGRLGAEDPVEWAESLINRVEKSLPGVREREQEASHDRISDLPRGGPAVLPHLSRFASRSESTRNAALSDDSQQALLDANEAAASLARQLGEFRALGHATGVEQSPLPASLPGNVAPAAGGSLGNREPLRDSQRFRESLMDSVSELARASQDQLASSLPPMPSHHFEKLANDASIITPERKAPSDGHASFLFRATSERGEGETPARAARSRSEHGFPLTEDEEFAAAAEAAVRESLRHERVAARQQTEPDGAAFVQIDETEGDARSSSIDASLHGVQDSISGAVSGEDELNSAGAAEASTTSARSQPRVRPTKVCTAATLQLLGVCRGVLALALLLVSSFSAPWYLGP
jgi:hypothetical protein